MGPVLYRYILYIDTHVGIVEEEEALISQLQEHVKNTTAPYKYPRFGANAFYRVSNNHCSTPYKVFFSGLFKFLLANDGESFTNFHFFLHIIFLGL